MSIGASSSINGQSYRVPERVLVQFSSVPGEFSGGEEIDLTQSTTFTLNEAIFARYVRLVILQISSGQESAWALGVSG